MAQSTSHFLSGPDPKLDLVYSDVWLPNLYSRRILCFELPAASSHQKAIDCLKRGLQSLVDGTPELGGQVVVVPVRNGMKVPWKAIRPYKGIELVVKDCRQEFVSYRQLEEKGFPLAAFKDQALMPIPIEMQPYPGAETVVQANLIEGGLLLSVCIAHNFTDGNGMNAIMIALGEQCKLAAEDGGSLPPRTMKTDRKTMLEVTGSKTDLKDHPAYGYLPGAWGPLDAGPEDGGEGNDEKRSTIAAMLDGHSEQNGNTGPAAPVVRTHTYRIPAAAASALKEAATTSRISTHDAVSALMWRTLITARYKAGRLALDKMSTFTIPHNTRRYASLPKDWVGNCTYSISASLPVSKIIAPNSLPVLAAAIRSALNAVNKDVVGGLLELRKSCTYDITWAPLLEVREPWTLLMTSFYHSELYGTEWGAALGDVKHFTTSDEGAFGGFPTTGFVGPRLPGEGCDVSMGLNEEEQKFVESDELWRLYTQE